MIYGILYDYEDDENDDVNNDDGDGGVNWIMVSGFIEILSRIFLMIDAMLL